MYNYTFYVLNLDNYTLKHVITVYVFKEARSVLSRRYVKSSRKCFDVAIDCFPDFIISLLLFLSYFLVLVLWIYFIFPVAIRGQQFNILT